MYLAASGVGEITICDGDSVDLTNLQRQIIHQTESIGQKKTESSKNTLLQLNPEIKIHAFSEKATKETLAELMAGIDVVIDATDNFETRHSINRECVKQDKPLVSGAAIRFDGQVSVFNLQKDDSPCYHCLFPEEGTLEETKCSEMGVFAPMVGIIGSCQAAEALKILLEIGNCLDGRLLLLDGLNMTWRSVEIKRDPKCSVHK